ncbi:TetR/AcrR family transcriptional regulator [Minwuia thermotolerans]|uniref:TetR family transcriptional regulator n=1 Tax=Minwuia thermotolerans TaxID=2056226 RepID=A0A2M9G0Q5_9PROT|nr:TetR/AcrR family transcriptional regulator [Minwuia thermotolerans]PJK29279.1 TetR family transcriptional regulator [Minwuia thermotolerans]
MRISREEAQRNRERIRKVSGELFRERGFDGVAVSDLMKAAGLTHGGFYNHFPSKSALAAAALEDAFRRMAAERAGARSLDELLRGYLAREAREAPARACPAPSLAAETARGAPEVRQAFAEGLEELIGTVERLLPENGDGEERRRRAAGIVARMAGAMMLSRAVPDEHPLADELLAAGWPEGRGDGG